MNQEECFVDDTNKHLLLEVACQSIISGFRKDAPLEPDPLEYPEQLRLKRATYVTLKRAKELRGCVGHLEARVPLIVDVSHSAFAAAFRDGRFPPLSPDDTRDLDVHISVLSSLMPQGVLNEQSMYHVFSPGKDGVVIELGRRRACFLPVMWERFDGVEEFIKSLKTKAGLPADYWSSELVAYTFRTQSFAGPFFQRH